MFETVSKMKPIQCVGFGFSPLTFYDVQSFSDDAVFLGGSGLTLAW